MNRKVLKSFSDNNPFSYPLLQILKKSEMFCSINLKMVFKVTVNSASPPSD